MYYAMYIKKILLILIAFLAFGLTSSGAFAAYRDVVQGETNLKYYWPMDAASGTVETALVGGVNINLGNGAVAGATGRIDGAAVSFDGVNDYASTASVLNLSAYNKVVVEALVYIPSYPTPTTSARNIWEYGTDVSGSNGSFYYAGDGGVNGTTAAANVALLGNTSYSIALYNRQSAAAWHHIVAVYDKSLSSGEVAFYIDGVLQTATSRPYDFNNTNNFANLTLYLMSRAGTSVFSPGSMQHLAIYSDLSAARIAAHADLLNTATAITLTGPTNGLNGVASTNFTVGGNATFAASTIVTPSDGGNGGTFTPTTVTLSSGTPTATFTYTPASTGTKTISVTNNQSLSNPSSLSYVSSNAATAVTLSGPSSGSVAFASTNFTVGADGAISGTVTVTPSDSSGGGTFTPTSVAISAGSPTATFTYTAGSTGTKTISVTNNGGLVNPSSVSYFATIATYTQTVGAESNLLYYWKMNESSGTSLAATVGGTALTLTGGATVGAVGKTGGTAVSFDGVNDYAVSASALSLSSYSKLVVEGLVYIPTYGSISPKNLWGYGTSLGQTNGTFGYVVDGGTSGSTADALTALFGNVGYNGALYTRPTVGAWHHVVTVFDKTQPANEVDTYIDGTLVTPTSRPFLNNNTNAFGNLSLYLMSNGGAGGYVGGRLQHVAIYSDLNSTRIGVHATLAAAAANISLSGPSSGLTTLASTNFTVSVDGTLAYDVVVTPNDGGDGGTFTPTSVTLTPSVPTATFTYTPESVGAKTISLTNNDALTNPAGFAFTANPNGPATTITMTAPSSGAVGVASSTFGIGADGLITGTVVVTPSDSGAGGTFTPTTVSISSGSPTATFTYTPYQPGTKTISITNNGSLANHVPFSYSVYGTALAIGDSTVATYDGGSQIINYLFTTAQSNLGWSATSIAVPGNTIAQQKTAYLATGNRGTFDVTFVEIGLNDLDPAEAASVAIARLQDLITTINANKKAGSKIVIATMTPAKQRYIDVYGSTNGLIAYQKWLDVNDAIKGNGATPITGVDARVYRHTDLLNDGSGNLNSIYDGLSHDHIHENDAARTIIGHVWRDGLARIGYTDVVAPSTPTIGTASAGAGSANVAFTISDFDGGADVTYTAISTPSSITGTGSSSPITVSGLSATPYTFKVYGTNTAGSSSQSAASNSVTPSSGDVTAPTISEVTPVLTPTNDATPDYTFTINEAGTITYGGSCSSATTSATVGSNTITFNTLTDATYSNCTITVTDAALNASTPLSVTTFRVDTTAPTVSTLSPLDNATGVSATANLVMTFTEAVTANTGNITIKKTSDNSTIETIAVGSGQVTGSGTTTITIDPSITFASFTEYYVQVDSGAFRDAATNSYAGISSTTAWSFTTIDADAPTITNITSSKTNGTYGIGEVIAIQVTFSEAVTSTGSVTITLETGATDRTCTFTVSNSASASCNYTVQAGDTSGDLNVNAISGTIADQSANPMTNFVPATNLAANKALVIDTAGPTLTQVTPVVTPGNDTTPNYVFGSTEAGTITYGGSCSSATTLATSGSNTITFNALTVGTYSNCTIQVTDTVGNVSNTLSVTSFTIETTPPTITNITSSKPDGSYKAGEVIAVQVTFSEAVTSTGSVIVTLETGITDQTCSFTITNASSASCNYTVQAGDLSSDLNIKTIAGTIADQAGNAMTDFVPATNLEANKAIVIDTNPPTLTEVTPITTPTTDTTPDYVFSTNEGGTVSYGGSCSSPTTSASTGSNTITFNTLGGGTYTNCTVSITDSAGNTSVALAVSAFEVSVPVVPTPTPSVSNSGGVVLLPGNSGLVVPSIGSTPVIIPTTPIYPSTGGTTTYVFNRDLKLGMTSDDVLRLQQFLNSHGFPISAFGPGSIGNETRYFGPATFKALVKFQTAYGIKPTSGFFGPLTRSLISKIK